MKRKWVILWIILGLIVLSAIIILVMTYDTSQTIVIENIPSPISSFNSGGGGG